MRRKPRLYLAAPLFSEAELSFNRELRRDLAAHFNVYLPQEDGSLAVNMMKDGFSWSAAKTAVFRQDVDAIRAAEYVLVVLDGRSIDEGAAFELGVGWALGKKCVGYQSDPRRLLPSGNNPMVEQALECIITTRAELESWGSLEGKQVAFSDCGESTRPAGRNATQDRGGWTSRM